MDAQATACMHNGEGRLIANSREVILFLCTVNLPEGKYRTIII